MFTKIKDRRVLLRNMITIKMVLYYFIALIFIIVPSTLFYINDLEHRLKENIKNISKIGSSYCEIVLENHSTIDDKGNISNTQLLITNNILYTIEDVVMVFQILNGNLNKTEDIPKELTTYVNSGALLKSGIENNKHNLILIGSKYNFYTYSEKINVIIEGQVYDGYFVIIYKEDFNTYKKNILMKSLLYMVISGMCLMVIIRKTVKNQLFF